MGLLTGLVGLVLSGGLGVASMWLLGLLVLTRLVIGLLLRPAGLGGRSRRLGGTGMRLLARLGLARLVWLVLRLLLRPSWLVRLCGTLGAAVLALIGLVRRLLLGGLGLARLVCLLLARLVRGLLLRPARLRRLDSGSCSCATDVLLAGLGLARLVCLLLRPARLGFLCGRLLLTRLIRRLLSRLLLACLLLRPAWLSHLGSSRTTDLLLGGLGLTRLVRRLLLSALLRLRRPRRARPTIKRKSGESSIIAGPILAVVQEVPALDEHAANILYSWTMETHGDIGPAHARSLGSIELVLVGMRNVGEVQDSGVVVILAVENVVGGVVVDVGEGVLVGVPASIAHV